MTHKHEEDMLRSILAEFMAERHGALIDYCDEHDQEFLEMHKDWFSDDGDSVHCRNEHDAFKDYMENQDPVQFFYNDMPQGHDEDFLLWLADRAYKYKNHYDRLKNLMSKLFRVAQSMAQDSSWEVGIL